MTLIAGFRCADGGILMCADREESGDGTKRSVCKLREWRCNNAHFIFGASGTAAVIANLYSRLEKALTENENDLLNSHVAVISEVLRSVHRDFKEFREWEELVIAASFYRDISTPVASFLYGTVGNALEPQAEYVCKGGGKDLARYFFHRLFNPWPDRRRAIIVAAFVFREVEDHVEGVGRGTDIKYLATQQRLVQTVPHEDVKALEDVIPSIKDTLFDRWHQGIKIPMWLGDELYAGEDNPHS